MNAIAVDYTPAIRQQAGIGRIIRGQIHALVATRPELDWRLFAVGRITPQQAAQAPLPLHSTPLDERNMVRLWHRLDAPWPTVETFTGGPLDIFHATDFVLAPSRAKRKVLTIHDLAFLFYPDASLPSLHRYLNVVVPAASVADHILADSHSTARDLQEQWSVPAERISVVQGAVDHERFRAGDRRRSPKPCANAMAFMTGPSFRLKQPPAAKNFVRLIEAYSLARRRGTSINCSSSAAVKAGCTMKSSLKYARWIWTNTFFRRLRARRRPSRFLQCGGFPCLSFTIRRI